MATTTRATPAACKASVQGGVRPWWQQGSSVTTAVPTPGAAAGLAQGMHLGMGGAGPLMEPFTHQLAAGIEHHAAHQGVGAGAACSQGGQLQGPLHPRPPGGAHEPMCWA